MIKSHANDPRITPLVIWVINCFAIDNKCFEGWPQPSFYHYQPLLAAKTTTPAITDSVVEALSYIVKAKNEKASMHPALPE